MAIEYALLVKAAIGIASAAYAYNEEGTQKKLIESVFSEIFGVIGDFSRNSVNDLYKNLKGKYQQKDKIKKDSLNHDLQKAARKAQLIATFFAAQDCLEKIRYENSIKEAEKSKGKIRETVGKLIDRIKTFLFGKEETEAYLEEIVSYLQKEIEGVENASYTGVLSEEEFDDIFSSYKDSAEDRAKKKTAAHFKADIIKEIEGLKTFNIEFKEDAEGLKLLKKAINDGWNDIPKEETISKHFVSVKYHLQESQKTPQTQAQETFDNDWFDLVCVIFNEEYKENSKVQAASDRRVMLNILEKVEAIGTLDDTNVKDLTDKISVFAADLKHIKDKVDKIDTTTTAIQTDTTDIKATAAETNATTADTNTKLGEMHGVIMGGDIGSGKIEYPNFVNLPNLDDKVYGRKKEIEALFKFLRGNDKHGIITGFSCLGKTSLIKKFLYKTLDEKEVKTEYQGLFEKVVFINCLYSQDFEEILFLFEEFLQTTFKGLKKENVDLLRENVFQKTQGEKILLVLDNFESWIENDRYKNEDVEIFLETLFAVNHKIRCVFLSWEIPSEERDFNAKVKKLDFVENELQKGLDKESAVKLVREEGVRYCNNQSLVDFDTVSEQELEVFFEQVFYIPQAIQSMVHYVGRKGITFADFMKNHKPEFEDEETADVKLEEIKDKHQRPTYSMLRLQISDLDEKSKYLLSHIGFYGIDVPQDILVLDLEEKPFFQSKELEENRQTLNNLVNDRLIMPKVEKRSKKPFMLYALHGFVRNVVEDFVPKHEANLENLGDQMEAKASDAWKNKFFYKQLALTECWEKIEDYFINTSKKNIEKPIEMSDSFTKPSLREGLQPLLPQI